jgi:hypothetical protein
LKPGAVQSQPAFNLNLRPYAAVTGMETALSGIRDDGYPAAVYPPNTPLLPTFTELQEVVGFPRYYEDEARYDTTSSK